MYTIKKGRPRWAEDKLCYAKLLRLQGFRGKRLKERLLRMEMKEAFEYSLIPPEPVPPRLHGDMEPPIDHAWVEGATCSPLFDKLTHYERWVCLCLREKGSLDLTDELGVSRMTCWRILEEIRGKLGE